MAYRSAASLIISMKVRYRLRCGSEHYSDQHTILTKTTELIDMTKPRFGRRLGFAALMAVAFAAPSAAAQQAQQSEPAPPKPGKLINAGDVLSGELNTMKVRGG